MLDLNPSNRTLPLGYDGLEAWEEWLEANHPASAARYLNPRPLDGVACDGCDRLTPLLDGAENEWLIDGHRFNPGGLIPYDPALADEIEASIHEYLETE